MSWVWLREGGKDLKTEGTLNYEPGRERGYQRMKKLVGSSAKGPSQRAGREDELVECFSRMHWVLGLTSNIENWQGLEHL